MAISWVPPLAAPTGLTPTLQAGGSLTVGKTYYVVVCAADSAYANSSGGTILRSAPSSEVSITPTSGNQTINLTWTSAPARYNVYITDIAPGTSGRWNNTKIKYAFFLDALCSTFSNSITITSENGIDGWIFDTFALEDELPGMDKNLGEGYVSIAGTVGSVTLDDLFAVVPSGYGAWDNYWFRLKGGLTLYGAVGDLDITDKRFSLVHAPLGTVFEDSFFISFNRATVDICQVGLTLDFRAIFSATDTTFNGAGFHGFPYVPSVMGGSVTFSMYPGFDLNGTNTFNNVYISLRSGYTLEGVKVIGSIGMAGDVSDVLVINSSCTQHIASGTYNYEASNNLVVRDCKIGTDPSHPYHIREYFPYIDPLPFYDCEFGENGAYSLNPIVYWAASNSYNNLIHLKRACNFSVNDEAGDAIQGASVVLKDNGGATVVDETTDINGNIDQQDVTVVEISKTSGGGVYDSDYTAQGPFTLSVAAPGYAPYKAVFDIQSKIALPIKLDLACISVDQEAAA